MEVHPGGLATQIENEIRDYHNGIVPMSEGYDFSQSKLVRRIMLFENHVYPKGKFDAAGNYKFWYDIQTPRINAEVKNIDFDTKDIEAYSERKIDALPLIITNLKLKEWMRETGQGEEINSAIEEGAGWGNVLWKKVMGAYERCDLKNIYIINQTAECIDETPVIERHQYSQSDIRAKDGAWDNIDKVLEDCKSNSYAATAEMMSTETTTPYYEIYERNGEVKLADLKREKGETPTERDENTYILAKVIAAGVKAAASSNVEIKHILFAETLDGKKMSDIYKEYHRSRYKGRWFREGIIELLFDCQVRANQIGNQMAAGLEWASKTIFASEDKLIVQNILSDMKNGDIIKAKNLTQVQVRMEGFDQLANDWNRNLQLADAIANSYEVVMGDTQPSGQPFRTTQMINQNANKLFDFIREKLGMPFSEMFEQWIIPDLVKDLKASDILRLTGDADMLMRLYGLIVDDWYLSNLPSLPPHNADAAQAFKDAEMENLKKRPALLMQGLKKVFEGFKPAVSCIITGENSNLPADLQTLSAFIGLEQDPVRRSAMIELAMRKKGIDVASLPKMQPQDMAASMGGAAGAGGGSGPVAAAPSEKVASQ